jgi:hypothetical protein
MLNKLTNSVIGLSLAIVSIALSTANPAAASRQTDRYWQKYLNGFKAVQMSSYSSGNGGGGISSKRETHFCSNGEIAVNAFSSLSVNTSGSSYSDGGGQRYTGTWKIVRSDEYQVIIEVMDPSSGQKGYLNIGHKQDKQKLYSANGDRLYHVPSDLCR